MPILRYDVTTRDWVILAPERARRPNGARCNGEPAAAEPMCPFCPGNEYLATQEIYAVRDPHGGGQGTWKVRVVPNKFPALRVEEDNRRISEGPLFGYMGGCGAHEVIIESPDHDRVLAQQPVEHVELVLRTLQARFIDLLRDLRIQTIVIFKNHGMAAGTSLRHPHWQLIGTPVVPRTLRLKHRVATDYYDQAGHCLYCALLDEELGNGERVLAENNDYAAILPYASHVPFETWILPKEHLASFAWVSPARFRPLADILKTVLLKLYVGLENPDFNLTINTAPRGDDDKSYFLWHIQILPRLSTPAGFELGSGMSINSVMPEDATRSLREVRIEPA